MATANTAYLGLGTNLGDRIQNLIDARHALSELPSVKSATSSSFYVSSPVGYDEQPNFINCVLGLEVHDEIDQFFKDIQTIETKLGRQRDPSNQNAPRVIDIDLLLYADVEMTSPRLTLPHPRLHQRLFVILPLLEISPSLVIPSIGSLESALQVGQQQAVFESQIIHKLG